MLSEVERLSLEKPQVSKSLLFNGTEEELISDTVKWNEELELFTESLSELNKQIEDFSVNKKDSAGYTVYTFLPITEKSFVRKTLCVWEGDQPIEICIRKKTTTSLYESNLYLCYRYGVGYSIEDDKKVKGGEDSHLKVEAEFVTTPDYYMAQMDLGDEILKFKMKIQNDSVLAITVINDQEEVCVSQLEMFEDTIVAHMPVFQSVLKLNQKEDDSYEGYWQNFAKGENYKIPISISKTIPHLSKSPVDFSGKWEVFFSKGTSDEYKAIGVFKQMGNTLTGTFITETGDYRFLEGRVEGKTMELACFDGSHAFLFKAELDANNELVGRFYSGKHWMEPWVANRNETATLRHPDSLTTLSVDADKFFFAFPDLNGLKKVYDTKKYKGKVTIVQLMGTWCPNCMDETRLLNQWHEKYNKSGLNIVGLCFETSSEFDKAKLAVKKLQRDLNVKYELLIAGKASKEEAVKTLPLIKELISYPTTIFIDKKGLVRKIHTGFYGPGTGVYYENYVTETEKFINQLLAE